jgi:hypothetical protein
VRESGRCGMSGDAIDKLVDRLGRDRERLETERDALLAAMHRAAEALDAYSDVNDGQDGPTPNTAMAALQEIDAVLAKAEGKPR